MIGLHKYATIKPYVKGDSRAKIVLIVFVTSLKLYIHKNTAAAAVIVRNA